MNLIEQLGGYEKARDCYIELKAKLTHKQKNNKIFMNAFDAVALELLQYRRDHNIFEVGDVVVGGDAPSAMLMGYGDGCEKFFILRHATDEEIKAGHRL